MITGPRCSNFAPHAPHSRRFTYGNDPGCPGVGVPHEPHRHTIERVATELSAVVHDETVYPPVRVLIGPVIDQLRAIVEALELIEAEAS